MQMLMHYTKLCHDTIDAAVVQHPRHIQYLHRALQKYGYV